MKFPAFLQDFFGDSFLNSNRNCYREFILEFFLGFLLQQFQILGVVQKFISQFFQRFVREFFQGFLSESSKGVFPESFKNFLLDFFCRDSFQNSPTIFSRNPFRDVFQTFLELPKILSGIAFLTGYSSKSYGFLPEMASKILSDFFQ